MTPYAPQHVVMMSGGKRLLGFCIILIIVYPNQKNVLPDYVFRAASPQLIKRSHSPSHHTCAQCLCAPQGRCTGAVISPPLWKEILSSPAPRAAGERPTNPHPFKTQNGASTKSFHPPSHSGLPPPPSKIVFRAKVCQHSCPPAPHRKGARGIGHQKHPYYIARGARFPVHLFWLPCTAL